MNYTRADLINALCAEWDYLCHDDFDPENDQTTEEYREELQNYSLEELVEETSTGEGYTLDELNNQKPYEKGIMAMANRGPNTNGSQFFIMHVDYPLPYSYTIFGQVTEGLEVIDSIAAVQTDAADKPLEDVIIESVEISES